MASEPPLRWRLHPTAQQLHLLIEQLVSVAPPEVLREWGTSRARVMGRARDLFEEVARRMDEAARVRRDLVEAKRLLQDLADERFGKSTMRRRRHRPAVRALRPGHHRLRLVVNNGD